MSAGVGSKLVLVFFAVALGGAAYGGWHIWHKYKAREALRAALAAPLKPCEDHRPKLPDAAPVADLRPKVLRFSSKCDWLAVGGQRGAVHILERRTGRVLGQVAAHTSGVEGFALSADDQYLFTSMNFKGEVAAWKLPGLEPVTRFSVGDVGRVALAFDNFNRILITGGSEGIVGWKIDFAASGAEPQQVFSARTQGDATAIAISGNGKFIAAGGNGGVTLWGYDGPTARLLEIAAVQPYQPPGQWVTGIVFSRDNKVLVTVNALAKHEIAVLQMPGLERFSAAGMVPPWEIYFEPGRLFVRAAEGFKGDRWSTRFELQDQGANGFYAAWAGKDVLNPAAFRGSIAATATGAGVGFWTQFGEANRAPVLVVPGVR